jgi:hypothetical protein
MIILSRLVDNSRLKPAQECKQKPQQAWPGVLLSQYIKQNTSTTNNQTAAPVLDIMAIFESRERNKSKVTDNDPTMTK